MADVKENTTQEKTGNYGAKMLVNPAIKNRVQQTKSGNTYLICPKGMKVGDKDVSYYRCKVAGKRGGEGNEKEFSYLRDIKITDPSKLTEEQVKNLTALQEKGIQQLTFPATNKDGQEWEVELSKKDYETNTYDNVKVNAKEFVDRYKAQANQNRDYAIKNSKSQTNEAKDRAKGVSEAKDEKVAAAPVKDGEAR